MPATAGKLSDGQAFKPGVEEWSARTRNMEGKTARVSGEGAEDATKVQRDFRDRRQSHEALMGINFTAGGVESSERT